MSAKLLDSEHVQAVKKLSLEALSLLTHVNYEINVQPRSLMKPDIGREFTSLGHPWGDDLQKQLKDIGDENKVGVKVQKNGSKQNYPTVQDLRIF